MAEFGAEASNGFPGFSSHRLQVAKPVLPDRLLVTGEPSFGSASTSGLDLLTDGNFLTWTDASSSLKRPFGLQQGEKDLPAQVYQGVAPGDAETGTHRMRQRALQLSGLSDDQIRRRYPDLSLSERERLVDFVHLVRDLDCLSGNPDGHRKASS